MRPMRHAPIAVVLTMLSLTAGRCSAFDVGDPSFRGFDGENRWQFEWIGDWSRRNRRSSYNNMLIGTPAGGPTRYAPAPPGRTYSTEIDHWKFRVTHYPSELFALHFHVGSDGETGTGDDVIILGGAIRGLLAESGPFQLAAQMQADFIPEFTQRRDGFSDTLGPFSERSEYDAYEFGASLLASMRANYSDNLDIVTYAGPQVSAWRGEWDAVADFSDTGDRIWIGGIDKQKSYFGIVVGTRLNWGETWSARVEGRFLEEESLSVGISASF